MDKDKINLYIELLSRNSIAGLDSQIIMQNLFDDLSATLDRVDQLEIRIQTLEKIAVNQQGTK